MTIPTDKELKEAVEDIKNCQDAEVGISPYRKSVQVLLSLASAYLGIAGKLPGEKEQPIKEDYYEQQERLAYNLARREVIGVVMKVIPSKEAMLIRIEEVRKNKCLVCEYHYDKNACLLHQVKNRDYCKQDLTDKEIITAIHTQLTERLK